MTPRSTSISPSMRPVAFCSARARCNCCPVRMPSSTSTSPMRPRLVVAVGGTAATVGSGLALFPALDDMALQEAPDGGVDVVEVLEQRRGTGQREHFAQRLVG